jgi:hypothetical protein
MSTTKKQGAVTNGFSNLVLGLAVDASAARAWGGYDHPSYEALTNRLLAGDETRVDLAGTTGILFDIGGCGSSDVFRLAEDDVVLVEHYSDDWNPDIEQEFLAIVESPLGDGARCIGVVRVESGVLALLHAGDGTGGIPEAAVVAIGEAEDVEGGVLLGVPDGSYEIWKEPLEAEGGWGTIASRVRVVRTSAIAAARAPRTAAGGGAKQARTPNAALSARRLGLPDGMAFVESLELSADGAVLVAGEKSGPTLVAWRAETGETMWQRALAPRADANEYTQNVKISIHGERIAAAVRDKLYILRLDDGRVLAEHALGPGATPFARMIQSASSFARFAPDGQNVLVGLLPTVRVLDWETGTERAAIKGCTSVHDARPSPDGSIIALPGSALRLCDARTFAVTRTVELPHTASASAFSPDGSRIAIASRGAVAFVDLRTGASDAALPTASAVQEVSVQDLAWSPDGAWIATASEDGYVRLWDAMKRTVVREFAGHDTTIPGTGARSLRGLTFSRDGSSLYVGGAPTGTRAATAYVLR